MQRKPPLWNSGSQPNAKYGQVQSECVNLEAKILFKTALGMKINCCMLYFVNVCVWPSLPFPTTQQGYASINWSFNNSLILLVLYWNSKIYLFTSVIPLICDCLLHYFWNLLCTLIVSLYSIKNKSEVSN